MRLLQGKWAKTPVPLSAPTMEDKDFGGKNIKVMVN